MSKFLSVLVTTALFASVSLSYSAVAVGEASVNGQAKKTATKEATKIATHKKKAKAKDEKTKVIQLDESNKGGMKTITVH